MCLKLFNCYKVKITWLRSSTWRSEGFAQLLVGIQGISQWDKWSYIKYRFYKSINHIKIKIFDCGTTSEMWLGICLTGLNNMLWPCCSGQCIYTSIHKTWLLYQDNNNSSLNQHRGLYNLKLGILEKLSLPPLHQAEPFSSGELVHHHGSVPSYLSQECRVI